MTTSYNKFDANFDLIAERVYYLKDRWADERGLEDFADYRANLVKFFSEKLGMTVASVSKSFKVTFDDGFAASFHANGRVYFDNV